MVPLTLLPQLLMGTMSPRMHFGPDTSIGILPQPHLRVPTTPSSLGSACRYSSRVKKLTVLVVGGPGIFLEHASVFLPPWPPWPTQSSLQFHRYFLHG